MKTTKTKENKTFISWEINYTTDKGLKGKTWAEPCEANSITEIKELIQKEFDVEGKNAKVTSAKHLYR